MTSKELYVEFQNKKDEFIAYIKMQKYMTSTDIFKIINPTLIANPNVSDFPKNFFRNSYVKRNNLMSFVINSLKFYIRSCYQFIYYFTVFILFKIYRKKEAHNDSGVLIDVFFLADKIIKSGEYKDPYFDGLYEVFKKNNIRYTFLPRIYGLGKNPFRIKELLSITNDSGDSFLFEFDLLNINDFLKITGLIFVYPFKTLRLLKTPTSDIDRIYNQELLKDIANADLNAFVRYKVGQRIGEDKYFKTIYSWSEFQVTERAFNYGLRMKNSNTQIIACQFFLNYPVYFNTIVYDVDFEELSSPHKVLVNGKYYLLKRKKVQYDLGVAFRYGELFNYKISLDSNPENILILGSYIEKDTISMLQSVRVLDRKIIFKTHPALPVEKIRDYICGNVEIVDESIYKLFKNSKLIITTASGTSLEALACGVSVIVLASQDNLTANPLPNFGQGEVWDIVFDENEIMEKYTNLMNFRENNIGKIPEMATWYRENFFVEPTEEIITSTFLMEE